MLFNSYSFILVFLPATVALFHLLRRAGAERGAFTALTLASLVFYGWWSQLHLLLLLALMAMNFAFARALIALGIDLERIDLDATEARECPSSEPLCGSNRSGVRTSLASGARELRRP